MEHGHSWIAESRPSASQNLIRCFLLRQERSPGVPDMRETLVGGAQQRSMQPRQLEREVLPAGQCASASAIQQLCRH